MKDKIEAYDWKKDSNEFLNWLRKTLKACKEEKRILADGYGSKKGGFVYFFKSSSGNYKLGRSKDPIIRLGQIKSDPAFELKIVHRILTDDMAKLENLVHEVFSIKPHKRIERKREWFDVDESHVSYLNFLGFEQFNFWDDYLVELELIENNISAYTSVIVAYEKGSAELTDSIRQQLDDELARRIECYGGNPSLARLEDLGQRLVDDKRWKDALKAR